MDSIKQATEPVKEFSPQILEYADGIPTGPINPALAVSLRHTYGLDNGRAVFLDWNGPGMYSFLFKPANSDEPVRWVIDLTTGFTIFTRNTFYRKEREVWKGYLDKEFVKPAREEFARSITRGSVVDRCLDALLLEDSREPARTI